MTKINGIINYALMSKSYLMEIDKMQAEILEYLSRTL